jgi:hypothetical protein
MQKHGRLLLNYQLEEKITASKLGIFLSCYRDNNKIR